VSQYAIVQDPTWAPLVAAAVAVRENAHAPYSNYLVGAALACDDETIVTGCNVENASYGATICAERNAVLHAVATGRRVFLACVVVTQGNEPAFPCGMCRQVLSEFARDLPILLVAGAGTGTRKLVRLAEIFPGSFGKDDLVKSR
jgi:cytidine deaminase